MLDDNLVSELRELRLKDRRQKAAEMILESEIVTSGLEDDEAEILLNWALKRAEIYALSTKDMEDEEANGHITEGVANVRRLMRIVNDLVEDREHLSSEEMLEELTHLISLARQERGRDAAEKIQESEPIAPALGDDEAEILLNWTVAQVEGYGYDKDIEGEGAHERIAESAAEAHPLAKMVNDLAERKDDLSPMEMVEVLTHLLSSAMEETESSQLTYQVEGEEHDKARDHRRDWTRLC